MTPLREWADRTAVEQERLAEAVFDFAEDFATSEPEFAQRMYVLSATCRDVAHRLRGSFDPPDTPADRLARAIGGWLGHMAAILLTIFTFWMLK